MKISQMNKLTEEHGSRTKLKFLLGKLLEALSEVTDSHEQLMEEFNLLQMILYSVMIGLQKSI